MSLYSFCRSLLLLLLLLLVGGDGVGGVVEMGFRARRQRECPRHQ